MRRLFSNQKGYVASDRKSKHFDFHRGTKQGDPLSSTIFNSVLESIMTKLNAKWSKSKYGIMVGSSHLQNLRFADDLLLIGTTRAQVKHVLEDLVTEASKAGLQVHDGKTVGLTNMFARRGVAVQKHIEVHGKQIQVLPHHEGTKYLGRLLCFNSYHDSEIKHRINRGWAVFALHHKELCDKLFPLVSRLRLFDDCMSQRVVR